MNLRVTPKAARESLGSWLVSEIREASPFGITASMHDSAAQFDLGAMLRPRIAIPSDRPN